MGVKKPNPEIFLKSLKKINLNPIDIIYVGDTDDDIVGAKAANIFPVLINRDYERKGTQLDYTKEKAFKMFTENWEQARQYFVNAWEGVFKQLAEYVGR